MRLWRRWFNDRNKREQWEAGLCWFRLRYRDPDGPTRALTLLSRPRSAGRLALLFQPGPEVSRLHVGVPQPYAATLKQMAADFAFSLQAADPELALPAPRPLAPVTTLPWERPFMAHIAAGRAFAGALDGAPDGERDEGHYLPAPAGDARGAPRWRLPLAPPAGLTTAPSWNGRGPLTPLTAAGGWPLGWARDGTPLSAPGRVSVYGDPEAVGGWLLPLVLHSLARDPAGLVVVDGAGDLASRLKRKPQVTRLLGRGLTYINLDGPPLAGGFNPLAPVPGETEAERLARWQRWFAALGVHPNALPLLAAAREDGVADLPALERWLRRPARQEQLNAAASMEMAVRQLLAAPGIREWLTWPADAFAAFERGALFVGGRQREAGGREGEADRAHLLHAVALAALGAPASRLICHGFPWQRFPLPELAAHRRAVVGNGPQLPEGATVLVASGPRQASLLAGRFLQHAPRLQENLHLLEEGEGIVLREGAIVAASWKAAPNPAAQEDMRGNTTIT